MKGSSKKPKKIGNTGRKMLHTCWINCRDHVHKENYKMESDDEDSKMMNHMKKTLAQKQTNE